MAQNVHIGALCDLLERTGITPDRYTATTLPRELDQALAKHKVTTASPGKQKRPLGYFAWMLRLLDTAALETEHERLLRTHNEAIERTRQQAAEREATRVRMAEVDQDEVARIIAAMKADAAMSRRLGRYPVAGTF